MVAAVHQPPVNAWAGGTPCVSPSAGTKDVSKAHVVEFGEGLPPNSSPSSFRSLGASAWGTPRATVGPATIARGVMLTASRPSRQTRMLLLTGPRWGHSPMNSSFCSHA